MVVNIYDTANELSRQLRETQEYQGLQKAFEALKADSDTFDTFKKFQQAQADAQHKQMTGQQPTDDEIKNIQNLAKEAVRRLFKTWWTKNGKLIACFNNWIRQLQVQFKIFTVK